MVQINDEYQQRPNSNGLISPIDTDLSHSDGEWEDLPEAEVTLHAAQTWSPLPLGPSKVRKRRPGQKPVIVGQTSAVRKVSSRQKSFKDALNIDRGQVNQAVADGVTFAFGLTHGVTRDVFRLLRYPITFFAFLYILSSCISYLSHAFHTVFSPICYLPGTSKLPLCHIAPSNVPKWANYPKLVEVQSSTFEQLLDSVVGSSELSLEIKKTEMATADLVTLVKVSDMKSKDVLARTLEDFLADAKGTGKSLHRLDAKIGGAVDKIVAVNEYALRAIEAAESKSSSSLNILWRPFSSRTTAREVARQTYIGSMDVNAEELSSVILSAEASLHKLDRLDERLQTLHAIIARENTTISVEKSELLAELWTILGGNRDRVGRMDGHLLLLRNIGEYRKQARAHVVATLQTLQGMSEDMEDLRQRVATPQLAGDRIPVEVHIKSIKAGLDRLTQKRKRALERGEEAVRRVLGLSDE